MALGQGGGIAMMVDDGGSTGKDSGSNEKLGIG